MANLVRRFQITGVGTKSSGPLSTLQPGQRFSAIGSKMVLAESSPSRAMLRRLLLQHPTTS
jgi:hypothetical protein